MRGLYGGQIATLGVTGRHLDESGAARRTGREQKDTRPRRWPTAIYLRERRDDTGSFGKYHQARPDVLEDGLGGTGRRARRTGAFVKPAGGSDGPV
jgi:hypothetical protein